MNKEREIKYHEEKILYGYVLSFVKENYTYKIKKLDTFISVVDNWAICDSSGTAVKFIEENKEDFFKILLEKVEKMKLLKEKYSTCNLLSSIHKEVPPSNCKFKRACSCLNKVEEISVEKNRIEEEINEGKILSVKYKDKKNYEDSSINPWEQRFILVSLLSFYVEEKYIDEIFRICEEIMSNEYYVNMSKAWLLSICYIKQKEKIFNYLKYCKLDNWTVNKTIQKIRESNRIDKIEKEKVLILKRK